MDPAVISTDAALAILAAIAVGAFFKGITGVGLPLFAVPAIASFSSVEDAVVIMVLPTAAANLFLAISHRKHLNLLAEHRSFLVGGAVGGVIGTVFLATFDDRWLRLVLVTWLALYLVQYFLGNAFARLFQVRGRLGALLGVFAGTAQGATGVSAHVVSPYFHNADIEPVAYAFLVASAFLVFGVSQSIAVAASPLLTETRLWLGLAALVPTLLFTRVGIALAPRVSTRLFSNLLLGVFVLLELKLFVDLIDPQ